MDKIKSNLIKINNIISLTKKVSERFKLLKGYNIKRCYVRSYNGLGKPTFYEKTRECRIIIGRPNPHFYKEVYAVIINY